MTQTTTENKTYTMMETATRRTFLINCTPDELHGAYVGYVQAGITCLGEGCITLPTEGGENARTGAPVQAAAAVRCLRRRGAAGQRSRMPSLTGSGRRPSRPTPTSKHE